MIAFFNDMFSADALLNVKVTFVIAVVAFVLSDTSWVHTAVTQRKSFSIKVYKAFSYEKLVLFIVAIENKSRLPISINEITLHYNDINAPCKRLPKRVYETTRRQNNEIYERKTYYSMEMPININALSSVTGYVLFDHLTQNLPSDAKKAVFAVGTNRGRRVKKTLELPEVQGDPHMSN